MQQVNVTHILPLTQIRRARMLPVRGNVLVRSGQKVAATDVIASGNPGNEHILLDIRRALNLSEPEKIEAAIQRKSGDKLQKGDLIAEGSGLFKRVVRAPANGKIIAVSSGQVLIEVENKPVEIMAGMAGTVIELIPDRGAILETTGALIQGVWGNGHVNQGLLLVVAKNPGERLERSKLDVSMRGAVVLGGYCDDPDVLLAADDLPLRGLILASMTADLIPAAQKVKVPIILTEGFGCLPINTAAYRILTTNEKRDVCLHASTWDPFSGERPEIVIPLPASAELANEVTDFKIGKTVRIHCQPYTGSVGTVVEILPGLTTLPSGFRAAAASVRLETDEVVSVPLVNMDVLE